MKELTVEHLQAFSDFHNIPATQLQWLISQGEVVELEQNDLLFNTGDPVNQLYIVLGGKLRICVVQQGKQRELRILDAGQVTGFLPYSRATITPAFGEALEKSSVFKCSAEKIKAGMADNYELTETLVHMMINRVREFTSIQQQNEKICNVAAY